MLTLTKNMSASDSEYAEFLEEVGVGKFEGKISPFIRLERSEIMCNSEEEVLAATYDKRKVRYKLRNFSQKNDSDLGSRLHVQDVCPGYSKRGDDEDQRQGNI